MEKKNIINGWSDYFSEGLRFMQIAEKASGKTGIFTPEILYNIIAMGIEKLIMGLLMYRGVLPENHTLRDLLAGLEKVAEVPDDVAGRLVSMDGFQEICVIEFYKRKIPTEEDIKVFLGTGTMVSKLVRENLPCTD